ncbi:MAG: hypothetical protein ACKVVP_18780 [Chloroflexota bacterium]
MITVCAHGAGCEAIGGCHLGNTLNGAQAEYMRVPIAQANLARIPDNVTNEQAVLLADIASTGFSGAESGAVRLGDYRIVSTLCPGGKERMRRLLSLVQSGQFDPTPLLTHELALEDIADGYEIFGERRDGVLKVAIRP